MLSPKFFEDYVTFMHQVLKHRNQKNPSYSLRAFARDIELSPARLSEVLRGKGHLGVSKLQTIAETLCESEEDKDFFKNLVISKTTKNIEIQKRALNYINQHRAIHDAMKLESNDFEQMSSWYYLGIWNYILLGKKCSASEIHNEFSDIGKDKVQDCLNTLCRLELIEHSPEGFRTNTEEVHAVYDFASFAVRQYHKSMLKKAESCLEKMNMDERYFYSKITSLTIEQYEKLTKMTTDYLESLPPRLQISPSDTGNSIHAINFQVFRLNKSRKL